MKITGFCSIYYLFVSYAVVYLNLLLYCLHIRNLVGCSFFGPIPDAIGSLTKLSYLYDVWSFYSLVLSYISHVGKNGTLPIVYKSLGHFIHCQFVLDVKPILLYHLVHFFFCFSRCKGHLNLILILHIYVWANMYSMSIFIGFLLQISEKQ